MDINLTSLLIPYYSGSGTYELSLSEDKINKTDPKSSRSLSLGEFIQALGIYKNIMCTTFPHHRSELDLYERDLVDMATRYPGKGFYEYHKRFSADAAAHLRHNKIPVDWSIRNNSLFCNIFANIKPNTCSICSSSFHSSSYCNQSNNSNRNTTGLYRAATSAAACGVEDHIIQTLGRWSSDCYIRYIRIDANVREETARYVFHN
ncbi:unnamed protein product [Mytilus coruscus]|uniref:Uncharacterized protein n=1 Tax=Mytilus coruscus TaxID=42192 RepID=A0A6J8CBG0_MYTCO|nr:unnamed protein product [Mytilus coruscus]